MHREGLTKLLVFDGGDPGSSEELSNELLTPVSLTTPAIPTHLRSPRFPYILNLLMRIFESIKYMYYKSW